MSDVLINVIVPLIVISGLGYWIGTQVQVEAGALAGLTFRLFAPALVFQVLIDSDASRSMSLSIIGVMVIVWLAISSVSWGLTSMLGFRREESAAIALCAGNPNLGNAGLPIAALAFGETGLEVAAIALVVGAVLTFTGGTMIASFGGGSLSTAATAPLRVPTVWAAVAAFGMQMLDLDMPSWAEGGVSILAGAAIPVMLVVLGLQVGMYLPQLSDIRVTAISVVLKLIVAPMTAAVIGSALGVRDDIFNVLIVLNAMPTAVIATVVAGEFNLRPSLVSRTVVVSTLASVGSLTAVITMLG